MTLTRPHSPEWRQLDRAPEATERLYGELRVEIDDQVALIYLADEAAHARVTRSARDAAALVQERMIPHRPARRPGDDY